MKTKTLLPILALAALGLSACGSNSSSVKSSSSSNAPASSSSSTVTTSVDDEHVDFKLVVTVAGITVDDTQNAVWMGTALGGTSGAWATYKFTKDTDGTWYHSFTHIEISNYKYNIYVDNKDSFGWNNINSEGSSASPRTLSVESSADIGITATFTTQPDISKTVDITVKITPTDITLSDWVVVYIWDSKTNLSTGTALTKATDGSWSVVIAAVPVNATFKVTACLGTKNGINWSYKSTNTDSQETAVTVTTTEIDYASTFSGQPDDPDAGKAINLVCTITNFTTGWQFPKMVYYNAAGTEMWSDAMAQDTADTTKFTLTIPSVAAGEYTCYIYVWDGTAGESYYADAAGTKFAFTMAAADLTITFSGAVAVSGGVGTIVVA
ncbi:MAG: hypothetical protein BWY98_00084 [Tenericutes bacterium ADurb.BinA155]|nr:MAG: hypothetical protein BWY98_00084 [Tenericutes bacterium ADurb.BinA155]